MKKVVGIDIGGTNIRAAVVGQDGKILAREKTKSGAREKRTTEIRALRPRVHDYWASATRRRIVHSSTGRPRRALPHPIDPVFLPFETTWLGYDSCYKGPNSRFLLAW